MPQVSAVITVWRRNHIEEQVHALLNQTVPPEKIWIYHCGNHIRIPSAVIKLPAVRYQFNSDDLGYFGRFSLALHMQSDYVYILDDDVIPSRNWIENATALCRSNNAIISSSGRIIPPQDYTPEKIDSDEKVAKCFIGDSETSNQNQCPVDTVVDYGCNSWLFQKDWLHYFWALPPRTRQTGEDIHFSAACSLKGGIRTVVPRQSPGGICGNLKRSYGFDEKASWRKANFIELRQSVLHYLIDECNWSPQLWNN